MPAYTKTPFGPPPIALQIGIVDYLWGSLNQDVATTRMLVTNVSLSSNVATVTVTVVEGNTPVVGQLISIVGTSTASGAFNVSNVALTGVTITQSTGQGTVTFALTHANVSSTPDTGIAKIQFGPTFESLPSTATASISSAVGGSGLASNGQRGISWFTQFAGSPSTVTINLQGADVDEDQYYTSIDQSVNTSGESRSVANVNYLFYRILAASTGGSSPTFAAGITVR